jgi:hypothetical protein
MIALCWYGPYCDIPGQEGYKRYCLLLEAIRQHFYFKKSEEALLPKDDPRCKEWQSRRHKCRTEWQRLLKKGEALDQLERELETMREPDREEVWHEYHLRGLELITPKGKMPVVSIIGDDCVKQMQAEFDAMMEGRIPIPLD